jgi:hypothetical protein
MKRLFYFATCMALILSASSCSKQCVQCTATDKYGVQINKSNVICDPNFERKKFEKRYESDFSGYTVTCGNVNN